ncbi:MAG: lipopolysaccharide transport periplasmic protein LptA [Rhodospirillales bacterium]|nr:lipopolysaccharide transport periplasmic protein LptA [Rhodospirillales bacterium]
MTVPALAQVIDSSRHDSSLPLEIEADTMEVEQNSQRATFTGAVDVKQGALTLNADTLIVHYREGEGSDSQISLIEVIGNVFFSTPQETAQGDSGTYDVDTGVITLLGNVVLTNDNYVLRGDEATMNLETGQSQMTGSSDRVKVIFDNAGSQEDP